MIYIAASSISAATYHLNALGIRVRLNKDLTFLNSSHGGHHGLQGHRFQEGDKLLVCRTFYEGKYAEEIERSLRIIQVTSEHQLQRESIC